MKHLPIYPVLSTLPIMPHNIPNTKSIYTPVNTTLYTHPAYLRNILFVRRQFPNLSQQVVNTSNYSQFFTWQKQHNESVFRKQRQEITWLHKLRRKYKMIYFIGEQYSRIIFRFDLNPYIEVNGTTKFLVTMEMKYTTNTVRYFRVILNIRFKLQFVACFYYTADAP